MSIDKKNIQHIATLSRLLVSESECESYSGDLSNILGLVEQMNSVDTRDVEPMAHPLEITARLREDEITEIDQHQRFQAIAPEVEQGLYLVPRVIE